MASFTWESHPAFRETRGGHSAIFTPIVFQVPLAQDNQYTKVAYLGLVSPECLH